MLFAMLTVLLSSPAHATDLLDLWDYNDYDDGSSMVGVDGWIGGYAADYWYGVHSGRDRYVYPTTDHGEADAPGDWGDSGARDNWLVNSEVDATDQVVRVEVYVEDNDSVGIICRFEDAENFYLLLMVGYGGSAPVEVGASISALVKVQGGVATVLRSSSNTFTLSSTMGVQLYCDDSAIEASVWAEVNDRWEDPDFTFGATDSEPVGAGAAGLYAYDAGGSATDATHVYFGEITVLAVDEDEDGVADDDDNCEELANADQADGDEDGLGDACDTSTDTGGDTAEDTGGSEGGSSGGGSEGGSSGGGSEGGSSGGGSEGGDIGGDDTGAPSIIVGGKISSCACAMPASGTNPARALLPLLALGLALARRRYSAR